MAKGDLGSGVNFLKYVVFFFNIVFFLAGIGIVAGGSYVLSELKDIEDAFESLSFVLAVPITVIIIGVLMIIISAFGCLGAMKENTCLLWTYLSLMIFTVFIEVAMAVTVLVYNYDDSTKDKLNENMAVPINKCLGRNAEGVKVAEPTDCPWLPHVQEVLKCCGFTQDMDADYPANSRPWQDACYNNNPDAIARSEGYCNARAFDYVEDNLTIVGAILGVCIVIEIVLVTSTCCIIRGVRKDNNYA